MSKPSAPDPEWDILRKQIIGLGEESHHKNYYPALKQSRDTLVRFRGVIEEIPDIVVIVDADDIILDLNRTAIDAFNERRQNLIGSRITAILGDRYEAMKNHGNLVIREDQGPGDTIVRELEVRRVRVDRRPLWVVLGRNVSHRIRAERQLKDLNQHLEEKVRERTDDIRRQMELLTEARDQLVTSEKMAALGNMVAGLAHEINTPLGIGVTASSSQMEEVERLKTKIEDGNLSDEDFQGFLEYLDDSSRLIFSNLKRAAELIQSFKQVAVDQSSDLQRPVDLRKYTEEVAHSLYPQWKRHQLTVEGSVPGKVSLVPGDWSQILSNLVVNSVKHGFREWSEGGEISVVLSEDPDGIVMTYRDNGMGMNNEQIEHVFEPFFTTARADGGTGLGMHIVYNLVTLKLNGSIRHYHPNAGGAGFLVRFPRPDS